MTLLIRLNPLLRRYGIMLATLLIVAGIAIKSFSSRFPNDTSSTSYLNFDFRKIDAYIHDSLRYFRAIDSIYATLPAAQGLYEIYSCKRGYFRLVKRDPEKTLVYADSILYVLKDLKKDPRYDFWYATALAHKGDDLRWLGRHSEAFGFYFLARESIQKTGDSCLYGSYSATLGMVAFQQKNYEDAAEYFLQAYQYPGYCSAKGNHNQAHLKFANQQSYLNNIGLCYSRRSVSDSALLFFDSALNYIDNNFHQAFTYNAEYKRVIDTAFIEKARGVIYGNKAVDLIRTGKLDLAERLLKESIRLNSLPRHALEDVPYSQAKLAALYLDQQRNHEAGEVLAALKAGLDSFPNAGMEKRYHQLQAGWHEGRNEMAGAVRHLKRYGVLKDSLDAQSEGVTSSDIRKEFAHLKTEYELHSLQKDDALKNRYLLVALAGVVLSVTIGFLIWRNSRQSKRHINTLELLNSQINKKNLHLQKTLTSLEKSHEDNSRMMKIVAHDLRNPIGGISGLSAIMLKEQSFPDAQKGMLEMIHKSSNHSLELIQDLVNINTSGMEHYREQMELRDLLAYCIEMLHLKAEEKQQRITLIGDKAVVQADREKLWRVFNNLISNAIKFSPAHTEIRVSITVKDQKVMVCVRDLGIGIPEGLKEKIFLMSGEGKRRGTAGEPSFGLGLGISKQIVESNNGQIWFENNIPAGTSFFVSFPVADQTA
ncbi:MAG: sensor histidine kinase [Chitinophagaceae bacterium]|nr:MAG: sensor histidine kinase [Chitinophagaceae bacterium]